jgi:hypothetical protein
MRVYQTSGIGGAVFALNVAVFRAFEGAGRVYLHPFFALGILRFGLSSEQNRRNLGDLLVRYRRGGDV